MSTSKIPASDIKVVKSGNTYQVEGRPREEFDITKIYHPSNLPGKQIVVGRILMNPNSASPPHTHGGAAIVAVVTDGTVLNQMNQDDPIITKKGDVFYESPGCHHIRILVVDDEVVKDGYHNIFVLDAERENSSLKYQFCV